MQGYVIVLAHPAGCYCCKLCSSYEEARFFIDDLTLQDVSLPFIPSDSRQPVNVWLIEFNTKGEPIRNTFQKKIELPGAAF